MDTKICTKCKDEKPIGEFYKDKQKLSGYRPDCKTCNNKSSAKWGKANKLKHYGYELKRKYGITLNEYLELLKAQDERCGICTRHISEFKTRFHVDHCHKTGKVRGLLCVNCNHGVGAFMEDPQLLLNTIKYLEK